MPPAASDVTVVLGPWPRTGTSLLMAMLTAGGLTPVRDDDGTDSDGHPVGAFQHAGVLLHSEPVPAVPGRACVKLFPRHIVDLAGAGWYPTRVIAPSRPFAESALSWARVWPARSWQPGEEWHAEQVRDARMRLALAGVPVLDVAFHDLLDAATTTAGRIAEFVGDLDVTAMAAVPDPVYRHFGGPAT